jgi:hypothetical protein
VPFHFTGQIENKLSGLMLVCANCHAMIHHHSPWKTPEQLKAIMTAAELAARSACGYPSGPKQLRWLGTDIGWRGLSPGNLAMSLAVWPSFFIRCAVAM